jgi:hypothetical protein
MLNYLAVGKIWRTKVEWGGSAVCRWLGIPVGVICNLGVLGNVAPFAHLSGEVVRLAASQPTPVHTSHDRGFPMPRVAPALRGPQSHLIPLTKKTKDFPKSLTNATYTKPLKISKSGNELHTTYQVCFAAIDSNNLLPNSPFPPTCLMFIPPSQILYYNMSPFYKESSFKFLLSLSSSSSTSFPSELPRSHNACSLTHSQGIHKSFQPNQSLAFQVQMRIMILALTENTKNMSPVRQIDAHSRHVLGRCK